VTISIAEKVPGFQRTAGLFTLPTETKVAKITEPETQIVQFCEQLFQSARYYRDTSLGMLDRWQSYRSWFLHSGMSNLSGNLSTTYVNLIYEKIEKLTADLTAERPEIAFSPHTAQDILMTELLNSAVPFIWEAQDMQSKYFRTIKSSLLYGTWYWKVIHDPQYKKMGGIEKIQEIPAWFIYPAPYAVDMDTCPWVIEISIRTVGEIEADYGVQVDPEIGISQFMPPIEEDLKQTLPIREVQTAAGPQGSGQAGGQVVPAIPESYLSTYGRPGLVVQKELWIRDGTTEPQFWFDNEKDVPQLMYSKTLKYPGGRVISWANGRLLYDRENVYRDQKFPYVKFTDVVIPEFWYGMGEVEPLINLQLLHDDTHEIIKQIHLFTALGRLVVDTSTGLEEDRMGNEPGEIWFVNPGTADRVKWLSGSAVPPELYNYLGLLEKSSDLVTGSHDVTRGINPTGVTAARALATLHNAASVRIRARLNDVETALKHTAKLIASRIQQFWPSSMNLRIVGSERSQALEATETRFQDFFLTPEDREATFQVKVAAMGNSDAVREAELQKMVMLFTQGMVSPETFIESMGLQAEEKILAELPMLMAMRNVPPPGGVQAPTPSGAPQGPPKKEEQKK